MSSSERLSEPNEKDMFPEIIYILEHKSTGEPVFHTCHGSCGKDVVFKLWSNNRFGGKLVLRKYNDPRALTKSQWPFKQPYIDFSEGVELNALRLTVAFNPPCYVIEAEFFPHNGCASKKVVFQFDKKSKCVDATFFYFWTEKKRVCSLLLIYGNREVDSVDKAKQAKLKKILRGKVTYKVATKFRREADVQHWPTEFEECEKFEPVDFVTVEVAKDGIYHRVLWLAEPRRVKNDNNLGQGGGTEHVAIIIEDSIDGGGDAENPRSRNQL